MSELIVRPFVEELPGHGLHVRDRGDQEDEPGDHLRMSGDRLCMTRALVHHETRAPKGERNAALPA